MATFCDMAYTWDANKKKTSESISGVVKGIADVKGILVVTCITDASCGHACRRKEVHPGLPWVEVSPTQRD